MKELFVLLALIGVLNPLFLVAKDLNAIKEKREVSQEVQVYFNINSKKYHKFDCPYAKRCTVNCVTKSLSEAEQLGGVPCKKCY